MLNYRLSAGIPSGSRAAWNRLLLQPLAHAPLTPLGYSLLAEVIGRAWFQYYDRIQFEPMPRARIVRAVHGFPYFNLTMSAQLEGESAAQEPITLMLNGEPLPIAKVNKPDFLAGLRTGWAEKRRQKLLAALADQSAAAQQTARAWHDRIRDYRWTQAEILQIMEEIEPALAEALVPWLASRQMLFLFLNRLLRLSNLPPAETIALLEKALGQVDGVTELEIARRMAQLRVGATPAYAAWLAAGAQPDSAPATPAEGLGEGWNRFLADYGHRAFSLAELSQPRWAEDPAPLLRALAAPAPLPKPADADALSALLGATPGSERKAAQNAMAGVRTMLQLQSGATDSLAWIFAGTRRWTSGAAVEANADRRILALDDVFSFELEELKQMMTNEWNISDSHMIQGKAVTRKAQSAQWKADAQPAELYIGDSAAEAQEPAPASPLLDPVNWLVVSGPPATA